jgi:hypothetical protein
VSAVYPSARTAFLSGDIALLVDTVKIQLVGAYTYDAGHQWLTDLTDPIDSPAIVTVADIDAGIVTVNPVTFPAVTDNADITALVAYRDSGNPATSHLLCHIDRRADTMPVAVEGTGGDLTFTFDHLLKL